MGVFRRLRAFLFGRRTEAKRNFVNTSALLNEEVKRTTRKNLAFQRLRRMRARKGIPTFSFCLDRRERENGILPIVSDN